MKVKYIVMKMIDERATILRDVAAMGSDNYEFFEQVLRYAQGNFFMVGQYKEMIMSNISIKHTTFWNRIKYLEDKCIITKTARGIYRLNTNWVKVFEIEPK